MPDNPREGFILPFTLILAASVIVLSLLIVKDGQYSLHRSQANLKQREAMNSLRRQVATLASNLEQAILASDGTSALLPADDAGREWRSVCYIDKADTPHLLHSSIIDGSSSSARFKSAVSENLLLSGWEALSPPNNNRSLELSWAAEDITLPDSNEPIPPFWPLPSLRHSPNRVSATVDVLNSLIPERQRAGLSYVPITEPLPFLPFHSPSLVPVPYSVSIQFGIFASGISGQREKVIRMRYYIDAGIWNPYNRPLQMHPASGLETAFQAVFWNLPRLRIINLSKGITSGWIDLDAAANASTGARGIHAWIRTHGFLEAGASRTYSEPDAIQQPEGLARTLHPGFMVGPADTVTLEFEAHPEGLQVALLDASVSDPIASARSGKGWFRMENWPIAMEKLEFARADDPPTPFHLPGGSLSFRRENTHVHLFLVRPRESLTGLLDPRQRRLDAGLTLTDAGGRTLPVAKLAITGTGRRESGGVTGTSLHPSGPLFSWPSRAPESLLAASDLTGWKGGSSIGSPGALQVNRLLDSVHWWSRLPEAESVTKLPNRNGHYLEYVPAIPVNTLSGETWLARLEESVVDFPSYPQFANPVASFDYKSWDTAFMATAVQRIEEQLRERPCRSIAGFFNRGILPTAFAGAEGLDPLHSRLPLRGWLRTGSPLIRHGSAWVLHLAIRSGRADMPLLKSARVWLLESVDTEHQPYFEIVLFEWMDPAEHLQGP
ncbi:MAG: hypothetical protein AB3N33_03970 [Puniceicoccaceae bacterium]